MNFFRVIRVTIVTLLLVPFFYISQSYASQSYAGINFVPNNLMTTPYGPAYADILLENSNFVPCKGGPIALLLLRSGTRNLRAYGRRDFRQL